MTIKKKPDGKLLPRLSFYDVVLEQMSRLAVRHWEQEVATFHMEPMLRIAIRFSSGNKPPLLRVKSIMWSLLGIFIRFNMVMDWFEVTVVAKITTGTLGVGDVKYVPENGGSNTVGSSLPIPSTASNTSVEVVYQNSTSPIVISSPVGKHKGLVITIGFRKDAKPYSVETVYTNDLYLILATGPYNSPDPMDPITRYDPENDCTMGVVPWSQSAQENFKWWMVVDVLRRLPDLMVSPATGDTRYKEIMGRIRWDGVNIGKVFMLAGNVQPSLSRALLGELEQLDREIFGDYDDTDGEYGTETGMYKINNTITTSVLPFS